jgi:hypothetical protein
MLVTFLFIVNSLLGLIATSGEWYYNKYDMVLIDGCYNFPSGSFNLFDYYCGMTSSEFAIQRANRIQENVFVYTVERIRIFVIFGYGLMTFMTLMQFIIPTFFKTMLMMLTIINTCAITTVYYYVYGLGLMEDVELSRNISILSIGFFCECFMIILSMILIWLKMDGYLLILNKNNILSESKLKE